MDALEQSAAVQALALVLAENLSREELARASLLLTQLGTTLATIVALCRIWSPRNRSKMGRSTQRLLRECRFFDTIKPVKTERGYVMRQTDTGALIAQLRKEQGLTQKQLAEQLHISDRTISKWERGVSHS